MDVILRCHFKSEGILFHLLVKGFDRLSFSMAASSPMPGEGCLYCSMQPGLSNSGAAKAEFQPIIGKTKQRNKRGSIFIKVLAIIAVSFKFNIEFFDNRICRRFINGFYMIFLISCAQQNGIFCFASLSSMSSMYI